VFDSEASVTLLIVGLTPALARALARGDRTTDITRLRDITEQANLDLRPQNSRSLGGDDDVDDLDGRDADPADDSDATEATVWYSAETDGPARPAELDALLRIPGVTAAYVTPDQGPP
jgi:hypothetical protein